jgi:hypothetical protein
VEPPSPEEEAETAATVVEGARRISVVQIAGQEPEVYSPNDWQPWELYAVLMRAAEIAGGEE